MNKIEKINSKIGVDKEILETLPKNNKKNINMYLKRNEEIREEFKEYEEKILNEIKNRFNKFKENKKKSEIITIQENIKNTEGVLYLLNDMQTSFEKMDLDRAIQNLNYYYKRNLKGVNESILYCIKKFKEIGIELTEEDFNYSNYVKEYIKVFFNEIREDENINSNKIKDKFEEIYWKCPEIITHIELNIRNLYLKNMKKIDKYYENKKKVLTKNFTSKEILNRYMDLKKDLIEKQTEDKNTLISDFISGKYNVKDYTETKIKNNYLKFLSSDILENANEDEMEEIDYNLYKLYNSIYEYKNYLKFQPIIDNIRQIYLEKDKYKKAYENTKKEIIKKKKKEKKINRKNNGQTWFKKANEKSINNQNKIIIEIKDLYKELENNKVYSKIYHRFKDNATLLDVLHMAGSFYRYLFKCIKDNNEITEEEVEKTIEELLEFLKWPYITILSNIELSDENKDILLIIKDRYKLLNINISEEDLAEENLDGIMKILKEIKIDKKKKKNKLDVEEIKNMCEFKKILEKNNI